MADESFGQLLGERIDERGLSRAEAGQELGVSQPQVSKWVNGSDVPSDTRAEVLADFLGRPVEEVVMLLHRARLMTPAERASTSTLTIPVKTTDVFEVIDYLAERARVAGPEEAERIREVARRFAQGARNAPPELVQELLRRIG